MSGLKLRCSTRIGILAEAAFKVGDHLLFCDIIGVLVQSRKFFLMWFTHGEEEGFFLHSLCWDCNIASCVRAFCVSIHFIAAAIELFEVEHE